MAAKAGPGLTPSSPAGIGATCWPSTTSGTPEPVEQAVVDHRLGAPADLFRGLEDEQQGAAPAARVRGQLGGRAEQAGDVRVVTAGVHDRHVLAVRALAAVGRRVVEAGPLEHRQRVHVGPQQHGRAVAVGQQADDAGAADARRRLVAEVAQPRGDDAGRPVLGERELGMRVQIAIDLRSSQPGQRHPSRQLLHIQSAMWVDGTPVAASSLVRVPDDALATAGRRRGGGSGPVRACRRGCAEGRGAAGWRGAPCTPARRRRSASFSCSLGRASRSGSRPPPPRARPRSRRARRRPTRRSRRAGRAAGPRPPAGAPSPRRC